jgi:hypothetical protein
MGTGRKIGLGVLGLVLGAIAGGALGLGGGLAWTTLLQTSSFEGYSGLVIVSWILAGAALGALAGAVLGILKG